MKKVKLKRAIGLPLLTLYGLGNILGAGIYVLVGEVAGAAGYWAPLSFMLAFMVAAFTAFSYMELSSRYPKTAGVPVYLHKAFKVSFLSTAVGFLLVGSGIVSAATLTKGAVGYFNQLVDVPAWLVMVGLIGILTAFALRGIAHSVVLAAVFTVTEMAGLILIVAAGLPHVGELGNLTAEMMHAPVVTTGVLVGAFIAFYAFIGFEDMVEVIEEVKRPLKTMPRAILLSLLASTLIYGLVVVAALLVLSPSELASSSAPLAQVYAAATGGPPTVLALIGLAAIVNGVLVQIIMGARVLFGLSRQGWIHGGLGKVDEKSQTPVTATLLIAASILVLAQLFPLVKLAELTSTLVLIVFALVNLSLIVVKQRGRLNSKHHEVRWWVPYGGAISTLGLLVMAQLI